MAIKERMLNEAKRIEEDCKYSSKRHFDTSHFWERVHYKLGIPSVALAAIAGASALSDWEYGSSIAGVISIVVAVLTTTNTFINPAQKTETHRKAGNAYLALKNQSRIFHDIRSLAIQDEQLLLEALTELTEKRDQLNDDSPQTLRSSFKVAQQGVNAGEAIYEVDK